MHHRLIAAMLMSALALPPARAEAPLRTPPPSEQRDERKDRDKLTDAAIVALIVAASIAAYKAMGKPCACPGDTMRNGRACGGNSAYARAGGFKPLCFPTDITPAMIAAYRTTKAVPGLR